MNLVLQLDNGRRLGVAEFGHPDRDGAYAVAARRCSPTFGTTLRFDARLDRARLDRLGLTTTRAKGLNTLDAVSRIRDLEEIGRRVSDQISFDALFGGFLEVR